MPELWLADPRGPREDLAVLPLGAGGYRPAPVRQVAGPLWSASPLLGCHCRLRRRRAGRGAAGRCVYQLATAP